MPVRTNASGGGGAGSDDCTLLRASVPKGLKAVTADSGDEALEGTLEAEGTAADSHVLDGQTYLKYDPATKLIKKRTGARKNNGELNAELNCGESYTIPAGDTTGGKVTAKSLASQTGGVTAEDGYVYSGKTYWRDGVKRTGNMSVNSVLSFSAAAYGGKQILLKWQNPYAAGGKPFSGVEIRYGTGGYPGAGGTVIYQGVGNNTAPGGWSQVVVTMPAYGTTYYLSLRPYVSCSAGTMYGETLNSYAATIAELWLTFTGSQSYVIPGGYSAIDAFAVGGGGGSYGTSKYSWNTGGGGGGYTKQANGIPVAPGQTLNLIVGSGSSGYDDGAASLVSRSGITLLEAKGGKGANNVSSGASGGSGGGLATNGTSVDWKYSGKGGSNGSGGYSTSNVSETEGGNIGNGQGTPTRAWGAGTIFSGGGGGGQSRNKSGYYAGTGGDGGGGNGSKGYSSAGEYGAANTGGGGGGCGLLPPNGVELSSYGGSGIVLLHVY